MSSLFIEFDMKVHLLFFSVLLISNQEDVRGQTKVLKCSESNDRCQLPFVFRKTRYEACTPDGTGIERPWCPTKIYDNGTAHVHYCMECWGEQRCYYTGESFPDSSWILSCPPGCLHAQKHTYGTNNDFSAASQICAAAIHEGLLKNDTGGQVILEKKPWKKAFVGAYKNGIRTYDGRKDNIRMMTLKVGNIPQTPHIVLTHDRTMISSMPSKSVTSEIINAKQTFASGITSDVRRGKIFWSDVGKRSIFSANFDGKKLSQIKVILRNEQVLKPEFLAFDWIHQNLFWTDLGFHSVSVADSNGQNVLTLIKRDNFDPRGLALDPRNGNFYVADFGESPKIEKCAMFEKDQCKTIIHEDILSPSGVTIDMETDQLCWADTKTPQISCANLDGSGRRNMKFSNIRLKHPFALVAYSGRIYWTDWLTTIMASADVQTWDDFHIHLGDVTKAAGLTAFESNAQPQLGYQNVCARSTCRYLCIPTPSREGKSYTCLCPDRFKRISDAPECEAAGPVELCTNNPCKNGGTCQDKDDKSGYVCLCDVGFKGVNCDELDVRIYKVVEGTGAIVLQCVCPKGVLSEILWTRNRLQLDPAVRWALIQDNGRKLTMMQAYYSNSGKYTCQFQYLGSEHTATELLIIKASPSIACGQSVGPNDPERKEKGVKVVGGRNTKALHAPFMAMLYKNIKHSHIDKGIFCGGSIINTKYILTAAHCFHRVSYTDVTVYVGKLLANLNHIERVEQFSDIKNVTVHPSHNPMTLHADIAIITLKQEIYYSEGVKPICILDPSEEEEDLKPKAPKGKKRIGIVYGWGITEKGEDANRLLEIDLPIVKNANCKKSYPGEITSLMFCVGGEQGRDTCKGDSGGPFTLWSAKWSKWFLAGIVSWGEKCGLSPKPGVYTRITPDLRKWIYGNTNLGA